MLKDLLFAIRVLRKTPGFVAIAVCSLAIGIGANSAIYSLGAALLLRPLPVVQPSRVVTVGAVGAGEFSSNDPISYPDFGDIRDRNHSFDGLVAWQYGQFGFAPDRRTQPRVMYGMFVSGDFFKVMGIKPEIGRAFLLDEDRVPGRDPVAIISHDLWSGEFGATPSIAGRKIWLNGTQFTIIGVAPETFRSWEQVKTAVFTPIAMAGTLMDTAQLTHRDNRWLSVKGRLKAGAGVAQANADVAAIAAELRKAYPKTDETLKLSAKTEFQVHVQQSPPDTALIVMLELLAICVLLVACANVAGLLLSRATVRAREISVKMAVGASRWLLIRQLMIEGLLLSLAGAIAGLGVAYVADMFFNTLPIPTDVPVDLTVQLDERALAITLIAAFVSTLIFGLLPALQTTRLDLITALKERDATTNSRPARLWGRKLIVAGQVALSLVLLIVSGVLLQGFNSELNKGPGFRTDHLQLMSFDAGLVHYGDAQRDSFYKRLLDNARIAPGVQSAALTANIPMGMSGIGTIAVLPEGQELKRGEPAPQIFDNVVSAGYFETMGIPIVKGRSFLETDKPNTPLVVIINEQMARHYWPKQNPIGKRIRVGEAPPRTMQIVGIAKQSKYLWISEGAMDYVYLPFSQNPQSNMYLVAESKAPDAASLVPVLRRAVHDIDWNMPIFDVRTMASLYENRAVATPKIITKTVAAMGLLGLFLSVIGLYGIISYSVSRRVREFGIRMAVGADRRKVIGMVLRQGAMLSVIGIAAGLIAGVFVSNAITSQYLFVFEPAGAMPYIGVSLLLLLTTMLGVYVPARRASRIDPMRALREE